MPSYPLVRELFACGPSKYEFDETGNGKYLWSHKFDVVAEVHRVGSDIDNVSAFCFRVLDKRLVSSPSIDAATEWEWRDEQGLPCNALPDAVRVMSATEHDYYRRILPSLKRIEASFYDSFSANH